MLILLELVIMENNRRRRGPLYKQWLWTNAKIPRTTLYSRQKQAMIRNGIDNVSSDQQSAVQLDDDNEDETQNCCPETTSNNVEPDINMYNNDDADDADDVESNNDDTDDADDVESNNDDADDADDVESSADDQHQTFSHDEENEESDKNCKDDGMIYDGARISRRALEILIMTFVIRHNVTDVALEDLLSMINSILPRSMLPSKYMFLKKFDRTHTIQKKYYCKSCESLLITLKEDETYKCDDCETIHSATTLNRNQQFFYYIPIKPQLENFINSSTFQVIEKKTASTDYLSDICSGAYYKNLSEKEVIGKADITLQINTDGVKPFKNSNFSFWPLLFTVNELPFTIRNRNMFLCGMWNAVEKPPMNLFLQPFVEDMIELGKVGIKNEIADEYIKVFALLFVADGVARPAVQNITQFNGKSGCTFCIQEGEMIQMGRGHTRVYPKAQVLADELRTEEQHFRDMEKAVDSETRVNGVKGPAIVSLLPTFQVTRCFSIDYMHNILNGVTLLFAQAWFDSSNHECNYYLGRSTCKQFDTLMLKIKPPCEITRTPRSIRLIEKWKASELRNFLLYYSYPCLKEIRMPKPYLRHWSLLIYGVYIFLQPTCSSHEYCEAKKALQKFVEDVEKLYGKTFYKFNVHMLLHVSECVRNFGMLWAHSAFPFEDANRILSNMFHNSQHTTHQICKNFFRINTTRNACEAVTNNPNTSDDIKMFIMKLFQKKLNITLHHELSSSVAKRIVPSIILRLCIENTLEDVIDDTAVIMAHAHCKINGLKIHSYQYSRLQKRCNSVIQLHDGAMIGCEFAIVKSIITVLRSCSQIRNQETLLLEIEKIKLIEKFSMGNGYYKFISLTKFTKDIAVIRPELVKQKVVAIPTLLHPDKMYYLTPLVNHLERD